MKKIITYLLFLFSVLHLLTMFCFALVTEHAYVVANFPPGLENIMLIYAPITITICCIALFLFELLVNKRKDWFLFFIAFIVNLSETIFVVGSLLFNGH